ncbi:MAG: putative bifunctional diguanylate cyclase/phosphodiesterase [Terasakiella sp.]|uniref:putative bifunctional diguanylate cyclase/phosphodiesterase n=1 Tax=unclassified Terasakiella TaxID=2614952 RepID=UPI003B001110
MSEQLKILLVEDSEDDCELLGLELRRGGLDTAITRVETAREFEEQLISGEWDLVLSDYNLPAFNAPAALNIAVKHESDLPFIIISGAVSAKDAVILLKAGAHDFIEKGDYARLVPAIERELREVKMRKERLGEQATLRKLFRAVEQSPISIMITDGKGRLEYVNPHYEQVTGIGRKEVLGQLPDILAGDFVSLEQNAAVWEAVNNGKEWRGEFCNQRKNGELFWENASVAPIRDENGVLTNLLISKEDITYRKKTEEKLYRQANFDELTGLPNRGLILDRLGQALRRSDNVALMTIDMDNFKKVNESLGHSFGDQLLVMASLRLKNCLDNNYGIGRVSGDEFAIVMSDISRIGDVENVVRDVLDAFSAPFDINGHELFVTISAGLTVCPEDGNEPSILFKNAEAAMRLAKEDGRNGFRFFRPNMNRAAEERLVMEAWLRKALEKEELTLYYQPIVEPKTGRIAGAEALIRWLHPEKGLIPPDKFIPLAEETGLIVSIGQWVIETACQALKELHASGFEGLYIAVNVSPQQIWSQTLVDVVKNALVEYEVPRGSLVIEVTESVCMAETETTLTALKAMSDLGVRLAVDDFGTGFSSLNYLKRYPFNILKIDRAFISDLPDSNDDAALVNAMLAMGHSLGLSIVAEGVETEEHVAFLEERDCDLLQGYYFNPPMEKEKFLKLKDYT